MADHVAAAAPPVTVGVRSLVERRSLSVDLVLFVVFLAALAGRDIPSLSWLSLAYLLVVPGDLLRRTMSVPVSSLTQRLVYAVPASVAVLIAEAALIEGIGKVVGVQRPLDSSAVMVGVVLSSLVLLCVAQRVGAAESGPIRPSTGSGTVSLAILAPMLAFAGVILLDNGRGPWLIVLGFLLAAVLLVRGFVGPEQRRDGSALLGVYSMGLSILWSFTLRTPYLYGFDINQEYASFATTMDVGYWQPHAGSAFNAMLSLTAMPAILTQTTGLSGLTLFKVAYPMVFAILPVAGLLIASRFLSRGPAILAVIIVCLNPAGFWQISAVARQEIALACFAGMMVVLLEPGGRTRARTAFAAVLGTACVFSHYSTSYVALAVLLMAALIQRMVAVLRRKRAWPTALPLVVPLLMLVLAVAWNMGVNQATRNVEQAGGSFLSSTGLNGQVNPIETWLKGTNPTPISPAGLFELGKEEAGNRSWLVPYPKSVQAQFPAEPASAEEPAAPLSGLAMPDYLLFTVLRQATLLAIVIGTVMLVARFFRRKRAEPVEQDSAEQDSAAAPWFGIAALAVSAVIVAAAMRSSTSLSLAYNSERLSTQLSLVFVVPLGLSLQWLLTRRTGWLKRTLVAGLALVGVLGLVDATGVRGLMVGTPAGNLQSQGEHVERYTQTPSDVAAADWLSERFVESNQVYTDRYGALLLRSRPEFQNGLLQVLTPALLDQRGYVLGTTENIVGGRARGQINNRYAIYAFPEQFLDKYKSRVYANGAAGVWN